MSRNYKAKRTRKIIKSFQAKAMRKRNLAERAADALTSFFGSVTFLTFNIVLFAVWIIANSLRFVSNPFDPYPYLLLTTALSLEAIILTIVVLMSQNREGKVATLRDELQLQVELISEREISKALKLLTHVLAERGIKLTDKDLEEMISEIDTSYIEKKLEEQISGKSE